MAQMLRILSCALFWASVHGADYGVDCSFPIHNEKIKCDKSILGDRQAFYDNYIAGCVKKYGKKGKRCLDTEVDRVVMSKRQPQSMVNYTDTGFKKIKAPKAAMDLLKRHWDLNKANAKEEVWPAGNTYVNHWETPTKMVSIEDKTLRGGGHELKNAVWDAVKPTIEAWTGMEQTPTSMYGIRVYGQGAVLNPHVDRLPLVSSCIINVDQDVDEDWVLEVYDRHDRAVNVTMEPGDMVLYESGSLIHGRPFPLVGRFFANIFIHFEPTGRKAGDTTLDYLEELDQFYPPYLLKESPELATWARNHPGGWNKPSPSAPIQQVFSEPAHHAAGTGDVDRLEKFAQQDKSLLHKVDSNGWQPIHEAVRGGHLEAVETLIRHGVDKNTRIGKDGKGESPLNLALQYRNVGDPVINYLVGIGAQDIESEL